MNSLYKTILFIGILGSFATPAIAMEKTRLNSVNRSTALSLQGVMSRNISSEDLELNSNFTEIGNTELIHQELNSQIDTSEKKLPQKFPFGSENRGEPRTNPFRLSIFQF